MPIAVVSTGANGDERKQVIPLLEKTAHLNRKLAGRTIVLEADKGYDCEWLRKALLIKKIFPLIPFRKNRGREVPKMDEVCKTFNLKRKRWQVERAFAWLKRRFRRLMLRWERLDSVWSGFATMAVIHTWLKILVG